MDRIKSISIPQPCHQSWQQMTVNTEGRHCAHCCKTVVDFTRMSDGEIIKHLSAKTSVCGRIEPRQLSNINYNLYVENLPSADWWKKIVVIIGMLGPFAMKVSAQIKPNIISMVDTTRRENKDRQNNFVKGKIMLDNACTMKGIVTAKDDGLPIPGVTVKVKGENLGTITDKTGAFTLNVPANSVTLVISVIGYTTRAITMNHNDTVKSLRIVLNSSFMGGMEVTRAPNSMWHRVKTCFGIYSRPAADSSSTIKSTYY